MKLILKQVKILIFLITFFLLTSVSHSFVHIDYFFDATANFFTGGGPYGGLDEYKNHAKKKALAFSKINEGEQSNWDPGHDFAWGYSGNNNTMDEARKNALKYCNESKLDSDVCFIFAENGRVVYEDEFIKQLKEEYYDLSNKNVNSDYIGYTHTTSEGIHFNIPKKKFYEIIENNGRTGFILKYHKENKTHTIDVKLPKNSPPIISDYRSKYGVLGGGRGGPGSAAWLHRSIDFYVKPGEPLLAAADGEVVMLNKYVRAECFGRVLTIKHSPSLYSTYAHIGEIMVKIGDKVKRGQIISESGNVLRAECGGGLEHLDFGISNMGPLSCESCEMLEGQVIGNSQSVQNPHLFWSGGKGKPECFIPGKEYRKNKLTLPVTCVD
ncbi:M23 family metallopeptidase [Pelagibacteraceae bacterium]|nr:M23 family metallopeptidase [Pelagibacteraceae bacterium]